MNMGNTYVLRIPASNLRFTVIYKVTNVIEAYDLFAKDDHQLVYYTSGIGTFAWTSYKSIGYMREAILSKFDLAVALSVSPTIIPMRFYFAKPSCRRFEKAIIDAYGWLVAEHKPGDRIFLFGAYTTFAWGCSNGP